tara:strand:+ start:4262 stop:5713 length:1452 start_codon:yes stop_codon:yes gene_type:complete
MYGYLIVSTYASIPKNIYSVGRTPFVSIEWVIQRSSELCEQIEQIKGLPAKEEIMLNHEDYNLYYLAFDTEAMAPGVFMSKETALASSNMHHPQSELHIPFVETKTDIAKEYESFDAFFSSGLFTREKSILSKQLQPNQGLRLANEAKFSEKERVRRRFSVPLYRHIIPIKDVHIARLQLNQVNEFLSYRPHETHYPIQGLILAARLLKSFPEVESSQRELLHNLIRTYPRRWFKPKFDIGIFPSDQVILAGWPRKYQYFQMSVLLHDIIRQFLEVSNKKLPNTFAKRSVLGSGWLTSSLMLGFITDELTKSESEIDKDLVRLLAINLIFPADGYQYLPYILRVLPDDLGEDLMKFLFSVDNTDKALKRLIVNLKQGKIDSSPVKYLKHLHTDMKQFPQGKLLNLSRPMLALAYVLNQVKDGDIDLGTGSLYRDKCVNESVLNQRNFQQTRPIVFETKHEEVQEEDYAKNEFLNRMSGWFRGM